MTVPGFKGRFTREQADRLGHVPGVRNADQEMIANIAYGSRLGNGPIHSGDGWRYRGRGPIQLTGKDNYHRCGIAIGYDLVTSPDLLYVQMLAALQLRGLGTRATAPVQVSTRWPTRGRLQLSRAS
jgi:putative chitinase